MFISRISSYYLYCIMLKKVFFLFVTTYFSLWNSWSQSATHNGHAHNDYLRCKPLHKALKYGFRSIEFDVFAGRDHAIVAHTKFGKIRRRTADELYFQPLNELYNSRNGADTMRLTLMIDIKDYPDSVLRLIGEGLQRNFPHLLKEDSCFHIQFVLSGKRPSQQVMDAYPFFKLDARISELEQNNLPPKTTRVSGSFNSHFQWKGRGEMPEHEKEYLMKLVALCEQQNVELRFWRLPNRSKVWKTFQDAGVTLVHVDRYKKYQKFMENWNVNN
jgi:hypothetical protein